jgi:hypothetical protein
MNIQELDARFGEVAKRYGLDYAHYSFSVSSDLDIRGTYQPFDSSIFLQPTTKACDNETYALAMVSAFIHEMGHHLDFIKHDSDADEFISGYVENMVKYEKRAWIYGIMFLLSEMPDLYTSKLRVYYSDFLDGCLRTYGAGESIITETKKAIHEIRKAVEL